MLPGVFHAIVICEYKKKVKLTPAHDLFLFSPRKTVFFACDLSNYSSANSTNSIIVPKSIFQPEDQIQSLQMVADGNNCKRMVLIWRFYREGKKPQAADGEGWGFWVISCGLFIWALWRCYSEALRWSTGFKFYCLVVSKTSCWVSWCFVETQCWARIKDVSMFSKQYHWRQ